ncbi:MAG: DUF2092 domain-containing protein [Desulfosarcina sp.]|nr:DUF2092 domain-containing protein [Desulfobacterales bacterium]
MIPTRRASILFVVIFCALAVFAPAGAEDKPATPDLEDPQPYFDRMAQFLSGARQFQTTVRIGYDVVQESDQKIEFSERRRITVVRPDRFRVEIERSNGEKGLVLFDGQRITAYSETHQVYAEAEKPGSLDDALVYFLRNLKMRMPLALMFTANFPEEIEKRLESLPFVEISAIPDTPCVHLAGRTGQIDFQVWIPQTGDPLPRRVVITYRDEEGQPNFWADFGNWNLAPSISDREFVFAPPAGTERIPFLAEMTRGSADENLKGGN